MTSFLDWRTEPIMDVPEIDEYVGSRDWTITCQSARCRFTDYGERTENWVEEMQEAIDEHREWHENGMPQ